MSLALTAVVQAIAPKPNKPAGTADSLIIGGFNATRASLSSISTGSAFEEARASLAVHYPQVTYTSFTTLTQQAVTNVDILILPATYDFSAPIAPLTAGEQAVLYDYVADGGCAILLPENQDFVPANESLIDPFGMDITGMIWGWLTVPVANPSTTPLTSGFHGTVASLPRAGQGDSQIWDPTPLAWHLILWVTRLRLLSQARLPMDLAQSWFFQTRPRLLTQAMAAALPAMRCSS